MKKQNLLILLVVGLLVLGGSYFLNMNTAYADTGNSNTLTVTVEKGFGDKKCAVRNATVSLMKDSQNHVPGSNNQTNTDGELEISNLAPGSYTLSASKTGCNVIGQSVTVTISAEEGENSYTNTIRMSNSANCNCN